MSYQRISPDRTAWVQEITTKYPAQWEGARKRARWLSRRDLREDSGLRVESARPEHRPERQARQRRHFDRCAGLQECERAGRRRSHRRHHRIDPFAGVAGCDAASRQSRLARRGAGQVHPAGQAGGAQRSNARPGESDPQHRSRPGAGAAAGSRSRSSPASSRRSSSSWRTFASGRPRARACRSSSRRR